MKRKLYDVVKEILVKYPATRSDDKKLIWVVMGVLGLINNSTVSKEDFLDSPSFESITRARRKVQENHPELEANELVKHARKNIENKGGNHVYHEEVEVNTEERKQKEIDEITKL